MFQTEHLQEKWQPVLEHPDLPEIKDSLQACSHYNYLENQEKALREDRNFLSKLLQLTALVVMLLIIGIQF